MRKILTSYLPFRSEIPNSTVLEFLLKLLRIVLLLLNHVHDPNRPATPSEFGLQRNEGGCRPLTLTSQKYPASSRDLCLDLYLLQVLMYSWKVCRFFFPFVQTSSARFSAATWSVWTLSPRQHLLHLPAERSRKQGRDRGREERGETESPFTARVTPAEGSSTSPG